MKPCIIQSQDIKLIGMKTEMSLMNNQTHQLWQTFMPHRGEIASKNKIELYSVELYPEDYFIQFNPTTTFEKWAAVEVENFNFIPPGLETLIIPGGKYAVFHYKGSPEQAAPFFQNLYQNWLPDAGLVLDNRPHFALMGDKYKNNHPDSEEEIWIPIRTSGSLSKRVGQKDSKS